MSDAFVAFVNTVFVPVGLMLIMFSMGLTLALKDFALVLRGGRLLVTGFVGQMMLLPLLALGLGALFALPPEMALGLFIVAICPAGTTSNALTFVGRGNVALAVVLTAVTSIVTVFTIPLLLSWALPFFLAGTREELTLSVPNTILQLVRITILPLGLGMLVHRFAPDFSARLVRWLRPTAFVILVGVIAFSVAVSLDLVLDNFVTAGPAIWTLNALGMALGLLLGRAIGASRRDSMTLAIEIGVQNVTLAIFLTLTLLQSLPLAVTQNIYGVAMILNATLLIRWFRSRLIRDEAAQPA
jgi:BASS family bile acid:Na+ symporter